MFKRNRILCGLAAMLLLACGTVFAADAGKKGESKAVSRTLASTVDFQKELGLDSPSLGALGARIEQARTDADPLGLAAAANELAACEKATGKTASVKADELTKEAVELAKRRYHSSELKAVAALVTDSATTTELNDLAGKATKIESDAQAAKTAGKAKGIMRSLHVDSHVNGYVRIYLDGNYVGIVSPGGDGWMYIGQGAYENTFLDATCGSYRWHLVVNEPVGDFTWNLYP